MRLAAIYAIGVIGLLLSLALLLEGPPLLWRDLAFLALPFAVLFIIFIIAFVILAVARRVGFAALWILLAGLWTWMMIAKGSSVEALPSVFLGWSTFALPLFVIGVLGTRGLGAPRPALAWLPRPLVLLTS